jgi:hypothetical protein
MRLTRGHQRMAVLDDGQSCAHRSPGRSAR